MLSAQNTVFYLKRTKKSFFLYLQLQKTSTCKRKSQMFNHKKFKRLALRKEENPGGAEKSRKISLPTSAAAADIVVNVIKVITELARVGRLTEGTLTCLQRLIEF